ncbi:acetate/propionate family kinase [Nocardioides sp. dk4132]|uniref:acetate/propionate family kinase n=1 Tax=unclassified Nocardioides TaxID=2615069 RepID=UPI001295EA08|nr:MULTISPECIES: acetate/propionate family kinase [unclassified Nocardioides]MQW78060.1 acetate/propionate family kinase [Nocardioides sp. dk4132]QGA08162.1 acetate/propionate family kinase [Nocardioides sp. dk884]
MTDRPVLVLNAGSSSLKYQVLRPRTGESLLGGHLERLHHDDFGAALVRVAEELEGAGLGVDNLAAVGHRVVHGGSRFVVPTLVDDAVLAGLEELVPLAPLHNPPAIEGMRHSREVYPALAQVAVFDTAYFADLPVEAATYALDRELAASHGIRRYGAHGISHHYVAGEVAAFLGRPLAELDQIVLHLGNGASATAIRGGRPVETSMGMTPLEGLVMGTRGGDLDPGVLLHLLRVGGLDVDELDDLLHHRSGLRGMCGLQDFRDLEPALDAGDEAATTAYAVYCHRLRKYLGAYLAVLGGADVITFTAGAGEHVPRLRADVLTGLERLGIRLDPVLNSAAVGPARISDDDSEVAVLVVPTHEELSIARQVVEVLAG